MSIIYRDFSGQPLPDGGILFAGRPLPAGVGLLSYQLWTPEIVLRTLDIPSRRGLLRTGKKIGARSLKLEFVIWAEDMFSAAQAARDLNAWCLTEGPERLQLPDVLDGFLLAECDTLPSPDMSKPWESFFAQFSLGTPEFLSIVESCEALPGRIQISGTVDTPVTMDFFLREPLENPAWTVDDYLIQVSGITLGPGMLHIDTEHGRISMDGEDIGKYVTLESDLDFWLLPGRHEITAPAGVSGEIHWRDRWM